MITTRWHSRSTRRTRSRWLFGCFLCLLPLLLNRLILVLIEPEALHEYRLLVKVLLAECIGVPQWLLRARFRWLWLFLRFLGRRTWWSLLFLRLWRLLLLRLKRLLLLRLWWLLLLRLGWLLLLRLGWLWLVKLLVLIDIELDALLENYRVIVLLAEGVRIALLWLGRHRLLLFRFRFEHWLILGTKTHL